MFFYWEYYKNLSKEEILKIDKRDKHTCNNGHSLSDLLIFGDYNSLKED